jgi:hypothetical protein
VLDYTKIRKKLVPTPDGQDVLRLRVGIVTAVNADGTADVTVAGTTVPKVNRLAESTVMVGAIVQMVTYRGSMMIIGRAASGPQTNGLGLWARGQATSNSGTISTTALVSLIATNTVTFVKNRVYEVRTHGGVQGSTANTFLDLRAYRTAAATQIGEFFRFGVNTASVAYNASGRGIYFTVAANTSGAVSLYGQASSGTMVHVGTASGTPRNIEVYDVGDASQFSGIATY